MNQSPDPSVAFAGMFGLFFVVWLALIAVGLALTVFWIVELIDVARREFRDQNTKVLWLLLVLLSHGLGSLIYYFVGKPQGWLPGEIPKYPPPTPYGYPPPMPGQYPPPAGYYPPPAPPENRQE